MKDRVTAVITAAGSGKRMGADKKKQYLEIASKPVLYHTLKTFSDSELIDEIILVLPEDDIEDVKTSIVEKFDIKKVISYVKGGKERQDSINNALNAVNGKNSDIILIHDGVRPFVTNEIIKSSIDSLNKNRASAVGVRMKDTIKTINNDLYGDTLDRSRLVSVQTPQNFRLGLIKECYKKAYTDNFYSTDDAALVEKYSNEKIHFVEGDYFNIKITTPEDLVFAEAILKYRER